MRRELVGQTGHVDVVRGARHFALNFALNFPLDLAHRRRSGRGALVHALLERLPGVPEPRREAVARTYLETRAPRLDEASRARLVTDALGVMEHPALKPLFGSSARAEASVVGRVRIGAEDVPVSGQIDRFAIVGDAVLIADFKTARPPRSGEPPPHAEAAQLALYRALLREAYPSHRVRAFLVWTAGPLVRELDDADLEGALARVAAPVDGLGGADQGAVAAP